MRDLRSLIVNDDYDQGGWCHDEKRNFIHTLVNLTLSKVCVEIGVYKGSSLFSFAEILEKNGGNIIGIDPWSFDMAKNELWDKEYENYIAENIHKIFEETESVDEWKELLKNLHNGNELNY